MKNDIIKIDDNTAGIIIVSNTYGEKLVLVDREDLKRISMFRWGLSDGGKYVSASFNSGSDRSTILLHRLIMSFPKDLEIDHINLNGLDNRKCNLREATRSQNAINRPTLRNNKLGIKGVRKLHGKYSATIYFEGRNIHIGTFNDILSASEARKAAEKEYHGRFAATNFPT